MGYIGLRIVESPATGSPGLMLEGLKMYGAKVILTTFAAACVMAGTIPLLQHDTPQPHAPTLPAQVPSEISPPATIDSKISFKRDEEFDWIPIFDEKDPWAWKEDGRWRAENGVLIGEASAPNKCCIETVNDYEFFELRGEVRVKNGWYAELRFWSYDYYAMLEFDRAGDETWHEVRISVDNREMNATLDGKPLTLAHGLTPDDKNRTISFLTDGGQRLEIRNFRIRRLPSGEPLEREIMF